MTEVEFATKYQDLIKFVTAERTYDKHTYSKNLNDIGLIDRNFAFPLLAKPATFSLGGDNHDNVKTVTVNFKSLRQPKFNLSLDFQSNILLHKIKLQLVNELQKQLSIDVGIENIKLLLKTKTVHDGETLSNLPTAATSDAVNLNVMISKYQEVKKVETPVTAAVIQPTDEQKFTGLSDDAWRQISDVLSGEIEDPKVLLEYLAKLKSVAI